MSCDQVGERLDWSGSKVSRIETGRTGVSTTDLRALLDLYEVTSPSRREELVTMSRQGRERAWWTSVTHTPINQFPEFVGLEAAATAVRTYEPTLVPGLLQTRDYAREVLRAASRVTAESPEEIEERVEVRLTRQQVLQRPDPPRVWAVLEEAVLRRAVGGRSVMAAQLDHLQRIAELPSVILQILPLAAGAHAGTGGAFVLLTLPDPVTPDVVYIEATTNAYLADQREEVQVYEQIFDLVRAVALDPDRSVGLVRAVARDL